jgi:Protein of unknown function (DUF3096)
MSGHVSRACAFPPMSTGCRWSIGWTQSACLICRRVGYGVCRPSIQPGGTDGSARNSGKVNLSLKLSIPGILALIAGILILLFRRLLNYLVGIYLIVVGLVLVFNLHF